MCPFVGLRWERPTWADAIRRIRMPRNDAGRSRMHRRRNGAVSSRRAHGETFPLADDAEKLGNSGTYREILSHENEAASMRSTVRARVMVGEFRPLILISQRRCRRKFHKYSSRIGRRDTCETLELKIIGIVIVACVYIYMKLLINFKHGTREIEIGRERKRKREREGGEMENVINAEQYSEAMR